MVQLDNINKVYRTDILETQALNNISLLIPGGSFVSVMGPSGSGKSTLLNIMGLLDRPSTGDLVINYKKISDYSDASLAKLRNEQLGFIFQSFHLIPDLTVLDNVEIPLLYRKLPSSDRKKLALEALEKVGLKHRSQHFPSQMSGGQQQRTAIARAIVGKPSVLFADEPTGNLDSHMGDEVMQILMDLNQAEHTTVVMVTHDERLAAKTKAIIRLFDGKRVS